ncbi:MAG: hypothetical protein OEZ22_00310 [Spirochaetia bacterium]|nr:hypothetical protein [Spirochaetia bacterium]
MSNDVNLLLLNIFNKDLSILKNNIFVVIITVILFFILLIILLKSHKKQKILKSNFNSNILPKNDLNINNLNIDSLLKKIQTKKLLLKKKEYTYESIFNQKIENYIKNTELYKESLFPFFAYNQDSNDKVINFFRYFREDIDNSVLNDMEEIESLWHQGYQSNDLALYLVFYKALKRKSDWMSFLFYILTYKKLSIQDRNLIEFYFQDIYKKSISMEHLKINIKEDYFLGRAFNFSYLIHSLKDEKWDIKKYKTQFNLTFNNKNIPYGFFECFEEKILKISTKRALNYLIKNYPNVKIKLWQDTLKKQIFIYGKYEYAKFLYPKKEFEDFVQAINNSLNNNQIKNLSSFLLSKPYGDIHNIVLYLRKKLTDVNEFFNKNKSTDKYQETEELPKIYNEEVLNWIEQIKQGKKVTTNIPLFIRWAVFLYFIYKGDLDFANQIFKYIGKYKKDEKTKIYYCRYLIKSGELEKAWNMINETLETNPESLLVLNEAAIYAFNLEKYDKAEEIFKKLKSIYPNHPISLYNEAVFFERKSKNKIREKWEEYIKVLN